MLQAWFSWGILLQRRGKVAGFKTRVSFGPVKQTSFFKAPIIFHGGELAIGKRKSARPLVRKRPIHCVLKSGRNVYKHSAFIEALIRLQGARFSLCVYSVAVAHDHVHFVAMIPSREHYAGFIRAVCGLLARKLGKGLWKFIPFTRIVAWGRDFASVLEYLRKNRAEAAGELAYEPRREWYKKRKNAR